MKRVQKIGIGFLCALSVACGALGMVACGGGDESKIPVKPRSVSTVEQLKQMSNGSYALENDIDLQGAEWTPIASFSGKLDGKGYKIYNFQLKQSQDNLGFVAENSGTIKNVTFENVTLTERSDKSHAGIVAGKNKGTIENCTVNGTVEASYCTRVGGIVGLNETDGKINGCINNAVITGGNHTGGIVGYSQGALEDCENKATVSGKQCVGGIAGGLASSTAKNVSNAGTITASDAECGGIFGAVGDSVSGMSGLENSGKVVSESKIVGGIIGRMWSGNPVEDVENTASVQGTDGVGGIIGQCEVALNIVGFENTVAVTGRYEVGGIVGWATDGCVFTGCENSGTITGKWKQGGIVGGGVAKIVDGKNTGLLVHTDGKIENNVLYSYLGGIAGECKEIENCTNTATITGVGEGVGGFAGAVRSAKKCTNTVFVTGTTNVGGIAGIGNNANDVSNSGKVTGTNNVGGIYGLVNGAHKVEATDNEGEITGANNVGGIVGYATQNVTLIGNENRGIITGTESVGGILGYMLWGTATGNVNVGSVTGKTNVGGIAGHSFFSDQWTYCENKGVITGDDYVGGIVGLAEGVLRGNGYLSNAPELVDISESKNSGLIKGKNHVGGIFGRVQVKVSAPKKDVVITNALEKNINTGNVQAEGNCVGGICGSITGAYGANVYTATIYYKLKNCTNSGQITGAGKVGGIVGEQGSYVTVEDTCTDSGTVNVQTGENQS